MPRMNKISRESLRHAERVTYCRDAANRAWVVQVHAGGASSFLWSRADMMRYPSLEHAQRAVRRIAPDLPATIADLGS